MPRYSIGDVMVAYQDYSYKRWNWSKHSMSQKFYNKRIVYQGNFQKILSRKPNLI